MKKTLTKEERKAIEDLLVLCLDSIGDTIDSLDAPPDFEHKRTFAGILQDAYNEFAEGIELWRETNK